MADDATAALDRLRAEIEAVDRDIVALIARRLDLCREIVPIKMAAGLQAHIPHRVQLVIDRWSDLAITRGINPQLMRCISAEIIAEGERLQLAAMNQTVDPNS